MPTYRSYDGADLAYREVGSGRPLLVVPGGPTRLDADSWCPTCGVPARRSVLPGAGNVPWVDDASSYVGPSRAPCAPERTGSRNFSPCRSWGLRRNVATMNSYIHARLAQQRLDQTTRHACTSWWRSHPATAEKPEAEPRRPRLHWIAPVAARITGA